MPVRRALGAMVIGATLAGVGGCGGGQPAVDSSTTEATVTGTVKVKGKLAKKGKVSFNPANASRKVAARDTTIRPDGTYEITTLVGENRVIVGGTGLPGDTGYDGQTFDVQPGTNTFDIQIPPPSEP